MPGLEARTPRSRGKRLALVALLGLMLAPGTCWHETRRPADWRDGLTLRSMAAEQPEEWPSSLRLTGLWELTSRHPDFGGFSALLALPGDRLVAYSDRGAALAFTMGDARALDPHFTLVPPTKLLREGTDIEAATRDPASGRRWLALEQVHAVARLDDDGVPEAAAFPPAMQQWPANGAAEAMLRLPDGRFLILGESAGSLSPKPGPGLLFDGDPVNGAKATFFGFATPFAHHPTDMALLPDGRVLILLRRLDAGVPPLRALLVVADPAAIRAGEPWPWTGLVELSPPLPRDNYEGMATAPTADGGADIWIISDDNKASLQRTLLVRLHWRAPGRNEKSARGRPRAPD